MKISFEQNLKAVLVTFDAQEFLSIERVANHSFLTTPNSRNQLEIIAFLSIEKLIFYFYQMESIVKFLLKFPEYGEVHFSIEGSSVKAINLDINQYTFFVFHFHKVLRRFDEVGFACELEIEIEKDVSDLVELIPTITKLTRAASDFIQMVES